MEHNLATQAALTALPIVATILTALLCILAAKSFGWVKAKAGLSVDLQVDALVAKAVGWAEAKAETAIAKNGTKWTGPQKLEEGGKFLLVLAKQYKLDKYVEGKATDLIEAKLGLAKMLPSAEVIAK